MPTKALSGRVAQLIREHNPARTLVMSYSSDGTALLLRRAWKRMLGDRVFHRHAKASDEYLVERSSYKGWKSDGGVLIAVSFRDPLPLSEGKTGWHVLACQLASSPSIRSAGHYGPCINHCIWDNGYSSCLSRLVKQVHAQEKNEHVRPKACL